MTISCISTDAWCVYALRRMFPDVSVREDSGAVAGIYKACAYNSDVIVIGERMRPNFRRAAERALLACSRYSKVGESDYGIVIKNGSRAATDIASRILTARGV